MSAIEPISASGSTPAPPIDGGPASAASFVTSAIGGELLQAQFGGGGGLGSAASSASVISAAEMLPLLAMLPSQNAAQALALLGVSVSTAAAAEARPQVEPDS